MDPQDRDRLNTVLSYEPDTAGGLMNTDTVSVRSDVTVEVVLRYLRMRGELPDKTDRLFVVDRNDQYLGTLALTRLLTEDPENPSATSSTAKRRASRRTSTPMKSHSCSRTATWCRPRWSTTTASC